MRNCFLERFWFLWDEASDSSAEYSLTSPRKLRLVQQFLPFHVHALNCLRWLSRTTGFSLQERRACCWREDDFWWQTRSLGVPPLLAWVPATVLVKTHGSLVTMSSEVYQLRLKIPSFLFFGFFKESYQSTDLVDPMGLYLHDSWGGTREGKRNRM